MNATVDHWDDLLDGRRRVYARTPGHKLVSVVIGHDLFGTDVMYAMLDRAVIHATRLELALDARKGRTDQEES